MIEKSAWYERLKAELDKDPKYWVESMRFDFVDEVERLMHERGITRAELARRLEASPAYVTQMLKALFNPTLLTLAKVSLALDARVSLHLTPAEAEITRWFDLLPAAKPGTEKVLTCWPEECGEPLAPTETAGGRDERSKATVAA